MAQVVIRKQQWLLICATTTKEDVRGQRLRLVELWLLLIMLDKSGVRGEDVKRCRCGERQRSKPGG